MALVTPARLRQIRVSNSDSVRTKPAEGVVSPVARLRGYLGILEMEAINPTPHGQNIGVHGPLSDPSTPELSGVTTFHSGVWWETAQLLHLAVVLATDPRPTTILIRRVECDSILLKPQIFIISHPVP